MTGVGKRVALTVLVGVGLAMSGCTAPDVSEPLPVPTSTPTHTLLDREAPRPDAVEGPGSRAEPLPLGETIEVDGVSVTVDDYQPEADATVEAAANDPAPPGFEYSIVSYTVANSASDEIYVDLISVFLVTPDDEIIDEPVATLDDEMAGTLDPGESVSGSRAFLVPMGTEVLISVAPELGGYTAYYFRP